MKNHLKIDLNERTLMHILPAPVLLSVRMPTKCLPFGSVLLSDFVSDRLRCGLVEDHGKMWPIVWRTVTVCEGSGTKRGRLDTLCCAATSGGVKWQTGKRPPGSRLGKQRQSVPWILPRRVLMHSASDPCYLYLIIQNSLKSNIMASYHVQAHKVLSRSSLLALLFEAPPGSCTRLCYVLLRPQVLTSEEALNIYKRVLFILFFWVHAVWGKECI